MVSVILIAKTAAGVELRAVLWAETYTAALARAAAHVASNTAHEWRVAPC